MPRTIPLLLALAAVLAVAAPASARVIFGSRGDDTLAGTDKRDHIFGRAGNDTIAGKEGSDFLHGQRGADALSGDEGGDYLFGGLGSDSEDGGAGADWIWSGPGMDALEGGSGNDHLYSAADDRARDVVDCGLGEDRAVIRAGDLAENCEHVRAISGRGKRPRGKLVRGTPRDDLLSGSEGRDFILARAGNDTVSALGGDDFVFGMIGNDTLNGDADDDRLWGGPGNDVLNGGDGNDWLFPGWGADTVNGEAGDDGVWSSADDGLADAVDCGPGNDRAAIRPGDVAVNCELVRTVT